MFKLRCVDNAGGFWLHDGATYNDLHDCKTEAQMAFDDEYVDEGDIIQAWEVDGEGEPVDPHGTAAAEYSYDDFGFDS